MNMPRADMMILRVRLRHVYRNVEHRPESLLLTAFEPHPFHVMHQGAFSPESACHSSSSRGHVAANKTLAQTSNTAQHKGFIKVCCSMGPAPTGV